MHGFGVEGRDTDRVETQTGLRRRQRKEKGEETRMGPGLRRDKQTGLRHRQG